ncbi:MAG: hypothetical protein AABZ64_15265, partial [Nitrospinota bacterium]
MVPAVMAMVAERTPPSSRMRMLVAPDSTFLTWLLILSSMMLASSSPVNTFRPVALPRARWPACWA